MASPKLQRISAALAECIAAASQDKRAELAAALEDWATSNPKSYKDLNFVQPIAAHLFDAIGESSDARL